MKKTVNSEHRWTFPPFVLTRTWAKQQVDQIQMENRVNRCILSHNWNAKAPHVRCILVWFILKLPPHGTFIHIRREHILLNHLNQVASDSIVVCSYIGDRIECLSCTKMSNSISTTSRKMISLNMISHLSEQLKTNRHGLNLARKKGPSGHGLYERTDMRDVGWLASE